jgi:hypothetical protein
VRRNEKAHHFADREGPTAAAMTLGPAGAAFADSPACEAQEKANWECKGSTLYNNGGKNKGKFPGGT